MPASPPFSLVRLTFGTHHAAASRPRTEARPQPSQDRTFRLTPKPRLQKTFIPQAAVEALDEGILLRFSGVDVVPLDVVVLGPFRTALLVNSVPLSETMLSGLP